MPDFIPTTDQAFEAWVNNLSSNVSANPTSYGLTAAIATTLAAKFTAFSTALEEASNPATRGGSTILAKDAARADLEHYCREVARQVQGTMTVTNQQRYDLGLTVRDLEPTPVPPPSSAPILEVVNVSGRTVRIRLKDAENPSRRGRPPGVSGASVFSYVGTTPPADMAQWKFEANTGRTTGDVVFPTTVAPGAQVWLTAFWFNPRKQSGPACTPVSTHVQFGGMSMAA